MAENTVSLKTGAWEFELEYEIPDGCRSVVLIVHGMIEHSGRYWHLKKRVLENGYGYACFDLPGHGWNAMNDGSMGLWPDGGYEISLGMIRESADFIKNKDCNVLLFAHSMGSYIATGAIGRFGDLFKGCVFSGTNDLDNPIKLNLGKFIADSLVRSRGADYKSDLLYQMAFKAFGRKVNSRKTFFDWISSDDGEVAKYIEDPMCGYMPGAAMFSGLAWIMLNVYKKESISGIPKELPIFLYGGSEDPAGQMGRGPVKLAERLKSSGVEDVRVRIYDGNRHECLNDTNRYEVLGDIIGFYRDIETSS